MIEKHLLVINYRMDLGDQVFSHQVQTVEALAKHYRRVTVLTGRVGSFSVPNNVEVISSDWIPGRRFRSTTRFLFSFIKVCRNSPFDLVFSHMTEVQSALIAIPLRVFRVPHFLWYAHKSRSIYFMFCSWLLTGIISSSPGSVPISSKKVSLIGQAINFENFAPKSTFDWPPLKFIHVGRLDPSKKVSEIIELVTSYRISYPTAELVIVGSPISPSSNRYFDELLSKYSKALEDGWLRFVPYIHRSELPKTLVEFDGFVHAFRGSLDKTLIEATATMLPVVTLNLEYLNQFGTWGQENPPSSLTSELESLVARNRVEVVKELEFRRDFARMHHSFDEWIENLVEIIDE